MIKGLRARDLLYQHYKVRILLLLLLLSLFGTVTATAQDYWEPTDRPSGGLIYCIAISPSGVIFAGTEGGGVYSSTDNGVNWIQSGLEEYGIRSITINSNGYIFVGAESPITNAVYRSTDNGQNWMKVGLDNMPHIDALIISSDGNLFAGVFSVGVFRSTDDGENWTQCNNGLTDTRVETFTMNSMGDTFVGTWGGGIFYTTDNGNYWTSVNAGLTNSYVRALSVNSTNILFAGTSGGGVFGSVNNGGSWTQINVGLTNFDVNALAINSSDHIFAGTNYGVFRSTNNGDRWVLTTGLTYGIASLTTNPIGYLYAGSYGGVFHSTNNGENWVRVEGMIPCVSRTFAMDLQGNVYLGTGAGFYRSSNMGNAWTPFSSGFFPWIDAIAFNSRGHIFAGTGGFWRSTNEGGSWLQTGLQGHHVQSIIISSNGNIFTATLADSGGLYRSTDNGSSWTKINPVGIPYGWGSWSICIDSIDNIYAGYAWSGGGVYRSTDGGMSWQQLISITSNTGNLTFTLNSKGYIYVATNGGGLFRSTDDGLTWSSTMIGMTNPWIIKLVTNSIDHIFAMTGYGIFRSTDNGDNWTDISAGLTNTRIQAAFVDSNGYILAGSLGGGIFRTLQSTNYFLTPIIGDYSNDWRVNVQDLSIFARAWREHNLSIADIGPADSIPPYLRPRRDGKIDLEDLAVFGLMWNWSLDHPPAVMEKFLAEPTGNDSQVDVSFAEPPLLQFKETKQFSLILRGINDIQTASIRLEYNETKIRIDSLNINGNNKTIVLKRIDNEKGYTLFDVSSLNGNLDNQFQTRGYVSLWITAKTQLHEEPVRINVQTYSSKAEMTSSTTHEVRFVSEAIIPKVFSVLQNYPNPFNPVTTIRYEVPTNGKVQIVLFNFLGQQVQTILDKVVNEGYHEVSFEGRGLPSGIYFYRVEYIPSGGILQVQQKKLVLLK